MSIKEKTRCYEHQVLVKSFYGQENSHSRINGFDRLSDTQEM
jgi:hypothetical protein